jgi:hypothetical protein
MIGADILIGAALQVAPPPAATNDLECRLVTPAGATIMFGVSESRIGTPTIAIAPVQGSSWPQAAATGTVQSNLRPQAFASRAYGVGGGRNGPVVHFGSRQPGAQMLPATIYRTTRRDAVLPLAHGSCGRPPHRAETPAAPPSPTLARSADLLDPAGWPSETDCRVLRSDGRVEIVTYFTPDARSLTVAGGPFGPARSAARRQVLHSEGPVLASFAAPNGAGGIETLFVYGSWGARLLRIDPAAAAGQDQALYGICGLTGIVRRPTLE